MTGLAIHTPAGQDTLVHEDRARELFEQRAKLQLKLTPREGRAAAARLDAIGIHGSEIRVVVETKARPTFGQGRPATLQTFVEQFKSRWLISYDKLEAGLEATRSFGVPFAGLLYFPLDDVLLVQRLWNADGTQAAIWMVKRSTTQATVNGGTANRENAYVYMSEAPKVLARRMAA